MLAALLSVEALERLGACFSMVIEIPEFGVKFTTRWFAMPIIYVCYFLDVEPFDWLFIEESM